MSVEFGGGSAEVWSAGQAPQDADRQVITNLYDTYAAHLFDYCVTVLRDPAAAADAVQDTLIAADAQIGKLRDPERLRVWLYCIARRQCLSDLPRGSETITPDEIFVGYRVTIDADTSDFEFPDVESAALARETLLVVTAALRGLSGDDQEVVSLAHRHGLGGADLATVLGISGRRAAALLSGASMRFEESADTATVLRAGLGACPVLQTIAGEGDPAAPPPTAAASSAGRASWATTASPCSRRGGATCPRRWPRRPRSSSSSWAASCSTSSHRRRRPARGRPPLRWPPRARRRLRPAPWRACQPSRRSTRPGARPRHFPAS